MPSEKALHQSTRWIGLCSAAVLSAATVFAQTAMVSVAAEPFTRAFSSDTQNTNSLALDAPSAVDPHHHPVPIGPDRHGHQHAGSAGDQLGKQVQHTPVARYKDGTYTGIGKTRIGAVQVRVTLKSNQIVSVQITKATTRYPISYISPILPEELLQTQDLNQIDVVSGATLSTEDFYVAVKHCLQQAHRAQVLATEH